MMECKLGIDREPLFPFEDAARSPSQSSIQGPPDGVKGTGFGNRLVKSNGKAPERLGYSQSCAHKNQVFKYLPMALAMNLIERT